MQLLDINHREISKVITGLPNMCGAIDGSYIQLAQKLDAKHVPTDYHYNTTSILSSSKVCLMQAKVLWDICAKKSFCISDPNHLRISSL